MSVLKQRGEGACYTSLTPHRTHRASSAASSHAFLHAFLRQRPVQQKQQQQRHRRWDDVAPRSHNQQFEELTTWISDKGGAVHGITAGECQMGPVTVRGLVAVQDIPSGTPVLSVPVSSTLQDTSAPQPYCEAPWNVSLAALLLHERMKGSSSSWWPYIATLPGSCCSPLLLTQQQLQEVQYPPAVDAIAAFQASTQQAFEKLQQQQQQHGGPCLSWRDWVWALHMVQSRSIRLAQMGCKVMIPGIDLLNHGGKAANGQLVLSKATWQVEGEPAVCFVTTHDIAAGQQVLWSYGQRSNDDFFTYHGFVLEGNPDESVVLFDSVQHLLGWAVANLQQLQGLQTRPWQQLEAVAEAAAVAATQEASTCCSSAAIPGTSSTLLVPLSALKHALQRDQRQQRGEGRSSSDEQHDRQGKQQDESTQTMRQYSSSSSSSDRGSWRSSTTLGERPVRVTVEEVVRASLKRSDPQRRLASLRLHRPEWGAAHCPSSAAELVLGGDIVDVRLPAVLAALWDQAAASTRDTTGTSHLGPFVELLQQLIHTRCIELLHQMPTSISDDQALLLRQQQMPADAEGGSIMTSVVQYRLAKKQLLQQYALS